MPTPSVDFYILNTSQIDIKLNVTCELIETLYLEGRRLYVLCDHQIDAHTIDEWLWVFKPESFVPHHLVGEGPVPPPPVQIGWTQPDYSQRDVLFNLSANMPNKVPQFQRIIEVVYDDEVLKQTARKRYRAYQEQQCRIQTHQINCETIGVSSEDISNHQ